MELTDGKGFLHRFSSFTVASNYHFDNIPKRREKAENVWTREKWYQKVGKSNNGSQGSLNKFSINGIWPENIFL